MSLLDRDFALSSGERVVALALDNVPPDHVARYQYACDVLASLPGPLFGADVFCGGGYGSAMLAAQLPCTVLAVDGSAESIARASQSYVNLNVFFVQKFFPFVLPPEKFDFIVSMESVEHVEQGETFFGLLVNALKPGGHLIISAPNLDVIDLAKNPYPWHYRHYSCGEILSLAAARGLTLVEWFGADCTLVGEDGRVVSVNSFSHSSGTLRAQYPGDTLTYHFIKDSE